MAPKYIETLFRVAHADDDVQQRGRNTIILAFGLIIATLSTVPLFLPLDNPEISIAAAVVAVIVFGITILIAQRGLVTTAALLVIGIVILAPMAASLVSGRLGAVPFFFLLTVLVAGITLRPIGIIAVLLLNLAAIGILWFQLRAKPQSLMTTGEVFAFGLVLLVTFTLVMIIGAYNTRRALRLAREARITAEETTVALQTLLTEQEAQSQALREALATQQQLSATVTELSMPVIPLRDDVLVVPLIGVLDSGRIRTLQQRILDQIAERHTRVTLLDITGISIVDAQVARGLLELVSSIRLLGTRPILVGLRAEVAQALVALDVNLKTLETYSTLQQGLEALDQVAVYG